jgi:hypothetical protein
LEPLQDSARSIANSLFFNHHTGVQLLRVIALTLAVSPYCAACVTVWEPTRVGPSFRIKVENSQSPVAGLRLTLDENRKISAVTDKDGFATFSGIAPGEHYIRAAHPAGDREVAHVNVDPIGPRNLTVIGSWPPSQAIVVRSLKGTIRAYTGLPQPKLSFDLFEGVRGRKIKSFLANEMGEFDIQSAGPGLYFLNLKSSGLKDWGNEPITGQIIVIVNSDATADHLDIDLGWSSCGLSYVNHTECPRSSIRVNRLTGVVNDPAGAVLADAKVRVYNQDKALVNQTQTDRSGNFFLPLPPGTFELIVGAPAFSPFQGTVYVEPNTDFSKRRSPFTVALSLSGVCSAAFQ